MKDRDEYPGEFRSVWLNSQMPDLPIRQLYLPANMYGVVNDHDYFQDTMEDTSLNKLGVVDISDVHRNEVHLGRHPTNCGDRNGHYEFIRQTLDVFATALNGLTAVSLHYSSFQAVERTFSQNLSSMVESMNRLRLEHIQK